MMDIGFDVNQDYFHWLCELVNVEQEDRSYWLLAKDLNRMPFYSLVPHDENRAMDGITLREEYLSMVNGPKYLTIDLDECTLLEMLVALAERINYETENADREEDHTVGWFWEMIDNLGLSSFSDDNYVRENGVVRVDDILGRLVERGYAINGEGGLFPLKAPNCDQRKAEIWYQMNAYLLERDAV